MLRRVLRYAAIGAAGLVLLALLAAGVTAVAGGRELSREFDVPAHELAVPDDSAAIVEGGRLARIWGCLGCHERDGAGGVFFETPLGDRVVAPNLTRVVREYDAPALERAIRHGVRPDGTSLLVMPSSMFADMSDADLGKVVAHLRSLPAVPDTLPSTRFGLMARGLAVAGRIELEADRIDHAAHHPPSPDSLGPGSSRADTLALGRYHARTGCPECHGMDLRGAADGRTPDLRIAAAYSLEQFRRLAREGVALDGQERGLMTIIARGRLAHLTEDEVAALHTYLVTLAD